MGWMDRLLGRGDSIEEQLARSAQVLDGLLAKVRRGLVLAPDELAAAGEAFTAFHQALEKRNGTEQNVQFEPEDRARVYAEAVKMTAIGHPAHSAWPFISTVREKVLASLRRRATRDHEPWIYLAAIQPALVEGELNLARLFYARIEHDAFLAALAIRWATEAAMWTRHAKERAAAQAFLAGLPAYEPWNTDPCVIPNERRWLLLAAVHPSLVEDPRTTLADRRPVGGLRDGLRDDWGIVDRATALQTIGWLREEGHGASLSRVLELGTNRVELHAFVSAHRDALARHRILAWDRCRLIQVTRASVALRFLSEDEAWTVLESAGDALRAEYASWEELGEDYALGHGFFDPIDPDGGHAPAARWLAHDPRSPWRRVPFGGGRRSR